MKKTDKSFNVFLIIYFLLILFMYVNSLINNKEVKPEIKDNNICIKQEITAPELNENNHLTAYFFDVGQGDATLIKTQNTTVLIDGGNPSDSSYLYSFLKKNNINHIDYIIASHPHEDHIGGLSGVLNYSSVGAVYCSSTYYDSETFSEFKYYVESQGKKITVPYKNQYILTDDLLIEFFNTNNSDSHINNTSLVVKITFGEYSFLFTGDIEYDAEKKILDKDYNLNSTVLKVAHHGSDTSSCYSFIREVMPEYAVISTAGLYNTPDENVLSRFEDAGAEIFRTDLNGLITIKCTSNSIKTYKEKNNINSSEHNDYYIGNLNSHKFHLSTCGSLPMEKNRIYFETRAKAIINGYSPCGNCKP